MLTNQVFFKTWFAGDSLNRRKIMPLLPLKRFTDYSKRPNFIRSDCDIKAIIFNFQ